MSSTLNTTFNICWGCNAPTAVMAHPSAVSCTWLVLVQYVMDHKHDTTFIEECFVMQRWLTWPIAFTGQRRFSQGRASYKEILSRLVTLFPMDHVDDDLRLRIVSLYRKGFSTSSLICSAPSICRHFGTQGNWDTMKMARWWWWRKYK